MRAVGFGLEIEAPGYNVFATGATGTGRRTMLEAHLRARAAERPAPEDQLYLFDFGHPDRPMAVTLPSNGGRKFAEQMRHLVDDARRRISNAFESENYQERRRELLEDLERQRSEVLDEVRRFAAARSLALELTPAGLVTVPVIEGKPVPLSDFRRFTPQLREQFRERIEEVEARVPAALNRLRQIERDGAQLIRELDREVALFAIGHLIEEIKREYASAGRVSDWLDRVREDMIEHLGHFRGKEAEEEEAAPEPIATALRRAREDFFARYEPNVLVSHADEEGAPVVFEVSPTYYNLFGRIEYEATFGALSTDHRHIRPGALHRANGGYLLLDARSVLTQPFAWEKLKEALRSSRVTIEPIGAQMLLFPTATLEPEPVKLDVKIVLVGSPPLYALLYLLDEDVRKLFKVRVDFDEEMPWEEARVREYAAFVARQASSGGTLHFDRDAVARVVEHGARLAGHQGKLSSRFMEIADLVAEASHWARDSGAELVRPEHVETAIEEKVYRSSLIEEKIRELIAEGTLLIDVASERVGQVNGISVATVGDYQFGRPVRITASAGLGDGQVINIDRESELSGPIHAKGFLILAGFLEDRYGGGRPLALRASLVFEQSYDEIEGDSASSAELFALLSTLAERPVKQGIAVTGSVNQHGRLQPIGALNEKIEGFFEVCDRAGLDGEQGVIIPAGNVRHLMLREQVVEAVRKGRFNIWAVETVDDGIAILTGIPAGERGADGTFPEGTVHRLIEDRLDGLAELGRRFAIPDRTGPDQSPRGGGDGRLDR